MGFNLKIRIAESKKHLRLVISTDSLNTKSLENGRIQVFAFKNCNFNTANLEVEDKVALTAKEASLFYTVVGLEALNPKSFIDLTTLKV